MQALDTQTMEVGLSTSTMNEKKEEITPNWFEQAIDDYDYERPKRGQFLEGVILRIDDDAILVDIGVKRDAIVPSWDLNMLPKDFLAELSTGSDVLVCVMRPPEGDQDLLVSLNKGLEYKSWEHAETYLENGLTFEVEIIGENRGGLLANFEGLRAFIPNSQVAELRRRDSQRARQLKNEMIGQKLLVKVIEVDRDRQRLILSALAAEDEKRKKRLEELEERQIILGKVSSTVKFGVFVDLDGIDGLVHISELDWQRVDRPSDLFKVGDEIQVQVIGIDVERERVSLSRKALLPSPWQQIEQKLKPGDVIEGTVKNVLDFGAFVEVAEGIEGLVHVSEIGYSATGAPQDLVKPGEKILVRVLDIDSDRERISLSMRRVPIEEQIAWMAENEIQETESEAEQPEAESPKAEVTETVSGEAQETAAEDTQAAAPAAETEAEVTEAESGEVAETAVEDTQTEAPASETEAKAPEAEVAEAGSGEVAEAAVKDTQTEAPASETEAKVAEAESGKVAEAATEDVQTDTPTAETEAEADIASAETDVEADAAEQQPAAEVEASPDEVGTAEPASEEPATTETEEEPAETAAEDE